jgi:hypothetical protein
MSDLVTLFITACGRPDLLEICLRSFVKYNTYPIAQVIICEDCEIHGIDDFAYNILPYPTKIIYNPKRLFQMKSIENGLQYITSPFVFHLEDDWEFYDYGFIEKSLEILKKNDKITSVWLHNFDDIHLRLGFNMLYIPIEKYYIVYPPIVEGFGYFSFNPGLRRIEIQKQGAPYSDGFDEGHLNTYFREKGMYSVLTNNINGYVKHIGDDRHIKNPNLGDAHVINNNKNLAFEYFSKNGEDKYIYEKYIKNSNIENPTYLELNVLDGVFESNTLFFEKYCGWKGILVEARIDAFNELVMNRPNNKLYNKLISVNNCELEYLYNKNKGRSYVLETIGFNNNISINEDEYKITKITPESLTNIIGDSGFQKIDFFSLNADGNEYNVLLSYDWSIQINTILVKKNKIINKIHELLLSKNYILIDNIGNNSFYALQNNG